MPLSSEHPGIRRALPGSVGCDPHLPMANCKVEPRPSIPRLKGIAHKLPDRLRCFGQIVTLIPRNQVDTTYASIDPPPNTWSSAIELRQPLQKVLTPKAPYAMCFPSSAEHWTSTQGDFGWFTTSRPYCDVSAFGRATPLSFRTSSW